LTEVKIMAEKHPAYTIIDESTWPRREHFHYYQEQLPCSHSMTAYVDVTEALDYAGKKSCSFSAVLMYAVSRTVNEMDSMKMMTTDEGEPGIWDITNPLFTVFHKDDNTFSDLWMDYQPDLSGFCDEYRRVIETYGANKGIKGRPGQPENFFCFSSTPWTDFAAYSCQSSGRAVPPLFPIIACGKYTFEGERYRMPVSLTVSHAAMDGYHMGVFFRNLQENVRFL